MADNSEFIWYLREHVGFYRESLELLWGPFDPRFIFGDIKRSTHEHDSPQTFFPKGFDLQGSCPVDIQISRDVYDKEIVGQGLWQVAHECVHLLNPGVLGTCNILEEGLATWFQDENQLQNAEVSNYLKGGITHSYTRAGAKELVRRCMPELAGAVWAIRSEGVRIRDITAEQLAPRLPLVEGWIIDRLCMKFPH